MTGIVLAFVGASFGSPILVVVDDAALSGGPFLSTGFGG
jgi:hypothetical protein